MFSEVLFKEMQQAYQNITKTWSHRTTAFSAMAAKHAALAYESFLASAMTSRKVERSSRARAYDGNAMANMQNVWKYAAYGNRFWVKGSGGHQPWMNHSGQMTGSARVKTYWDGGSTGEVYDIRTATVTAYYAPFSSDHRWDNGKSYSKHVFHNYGVLTDYLNDIQGRGKSLPDVRMSYNLIKQKYGLKYKTYDNKNKQSWHRKQAVHLFSIETQSGTLSGEAPTLHTNYGI